MAAERILYWGSGSAPCWRVQIVLAEKDLPYTSKLVEFSKGEHKSPEVLALNPRGQVPTFKDGDAVVNESLAAMIYLEETYPSPALSPSDKHARAQTLQRTIEATNLYDKLVAVYRPKMRGELKTPEDEEKWKASMATAKAELEIWDGYLSQAQYAAGDAFSLADVTLAPTVLFLRRLGATLAALPHLKAYGERVAERPSLQATWPPHWKTSEGPGWLGEFL